MHSPPDRFVVRDFVWDDNAIAASKEELTKLNQDKRKHFVSFFFPFCTVNYQNFCRAHEKEGGEKKIV